MKMQLAALAGIAAYLIFATSFAGVLTGAILIR
jgi:hypothetical protein